MELIINGATFILKALNYERRILFNQKILSFYNFQAENFDLFIAEVRNILKDTHGISLPLSAVKNNFFKTHKEACLSVIWDFLKDDDKRYLKTAQSLKIDDEQIKLFIETICAKIKRFVEASKRISNDSGQNEDIMAIYTYVSSVFGWTIDHVQDMDEMELLSVLEEAILIEKKNRVNRVNSQSLVAAFASGSKQAKSEIDKLNRSLRNDIFMKKAAKDNPELKIKDELTREQIAKFLGVGHG